MDFKKQQLKTPVGIWVPLVRCEHHSSEQAPEKRLNLSLNGNIYSSKLYWESEFVHLIPAQYLTQDLVEFSIKPLKSFMRTRSTNATPYMLDLRPYANAMPEHPWIWGNWGEEMDEFSQSLTDGTFTSFGVDFEISGLIQLNGILGKQWLKSFVRENFPRESGLIQVPSKFHKIHILGGTVFVSEIGAKVAFLDLISADGTTLASIPWEYGSDVIDIFLAAEISKVLATRGKIAWKEEVRFRGVDKTVSIFQLEFVNPVIDQDIAFVRLRSGNHISSPFLLGLTLEP